MRLAGFGVTVDLEGPGEVLDQVASDVAFFLQPVTEATEPTVERVTVAIEHDGPDTLRWRHGDASGTERTADALCAAVRKQLEQHVAEHSPTHVFVHAGVVVVNGRAIVLPGRSFTGKSTATEALVDAGATYYSDEYAVLDTDGLVHAFPRPINRRTGEGVALVRLDGGGPPVPAGTVALARYVAGAEWRPVPVDTGEAVLQVIEQTVGARTDPPRVLHCLTAALERATVLRGERGDAATFARLLLDG